MWLIIQAVFFFALFAPSTLSSPFKTAENEEEHKAYKKYLHHIKDKNIMVNQNLSLQDHTFAHIPKRPDPRLQRDMNGRELIQCSTFTPKDTYISRDDVYCYRTSKTTMPVCMMRYIFIGGSYKDTDRLIIIGGCEEVNIHDYTYCNEECDLERTAIPLTANTTTVNLDCCCTTEFCNQDHKAVAQKYIERLQKADELDRAEELSKQQYHEVQSSKDQNNF